MLWGRPIILRSRFPHHHVEGKFLHRDLSAFQVAHHLGQELSDVRPRPFEVLRRLYLPKDFESRIESFLEVLRSLRLFPCHSADVDDPVWEDSKVVLLPT